MTKSSVSVTAIVPAAGSGSRMNVGIPKPLLELDGKTIIERSLDAITHSGPISQIVVLCPSSFYSEFLFLKERYPNLDLLIGGNTRQESVKIGLDSLATTLEPDDIILVHDAARCLVSKEVVARAIEAAKHYGAITVAIPMVDSVKEVDHNLEVTRSLNRDTLWSIQTPQVFKAHLLQMAHREGIIGATDDASLVESIHKVRIIEGDRENIKVTTPMDLEIARYLLSKSRTKI